jgi:hypothetical protein
MPNCNCYNHWLAVSEVGIITRELYATVIRCIVVITLHMLHLSYMPWACHEIVRALSNAGENIWQPSICTLFQQVSGNRYKYTVKINVMRTPVVLNAIWMHYASHPRVTQHGKQTCCATRNIRKTLEVTSAVILIIKNNFRSYNRPPADHLSSTITIMQKYLHYRHATT